MDKFNFNTGFRVMRSAIKNGEDLQQTLNELIGDGKVKAAHDFYSGALTNLLDSFIALRSVGRVPKYKDATVQKFMHSERHQMVAKLVPLLSAREANGDQLLKAMCKVVADHRDWLQFRDEDPLPTVEKADPILKVEVVSLPTRVMTQTVHRDENMEITGTTTTEIDASYK